MIETPGMAGSSQRDLLPQTQTLINGIESRLRWGPAVVSSKALRADSEYRAPGPYTAIIFRAIPYICNALRVR
jgi:hypothetical protein